MKQKTLQEQYNLIKEGKGNAEVFMKAAKKQFPNFVRNAATLNETISSLKHNHIISESMLGLGMVSSTKPTTPDWFKIFNENMEGDQEQKYPTEIKNLIDAFMVAKNSYNDLSKMTVDSTPGGNWRLYYDGKDTGLTYNGRLLSDKTIMDYDLEHYGGYDELNEAKAIEKKPTKDVVDLETKGYDYKDKEKVDNIYGEAFLKGYYTEMKDPKNADKTVDELKEIVAKNLTKDRLYYTKEAQFGIKGIGYTDQTPGLKASESDQMVPVKLSEGRVTKTVTEAKKPKKETTNSKLAEIEKNGKIATLEIQIDALDEIIESKNQRISMVTEDENLSELVDKNKMKEMQREIKELEKRKAKMEKLYEKMCGKRYAKKEVVGEDYDPDEEQKRDEDEIFMAYDDEGMPL
jgi:hypothetical protein